MSEQELCLTESEMTPTTQQYMQSSESEYIPKVSSQSESEEPRRTSL